MGFNSAFKGLKLLKNPGNGRLNNLIDPVLNVLKLKQDVGIRSPVTQCRVPGEQTARLHI